MQHKRQHVWLYRVGFILIALGVLGFNVLVTQAAVPAVNGIQSETADPLACVNPTGTGCDAVCAGMCYPASGLQAAVNNASIGGVIRIAAGTYTGSGPAVVQINKQVTLQGGYNASCATQTGGETILDGQYARTVIEVDASSLSLVTLDALTLRNGVGNGNCDANNEVDYVGCGGGLYVNDTPVVVTSCDFLNNTSSTTGTGAGGGVFVFNATYGDSAQFSDNVFRNNTASTASKGWGGGLYLDAGVDLTRASVNNNIFEGNVATTKFEGFGGGAYISGYANVLENEIFDNYAARAEAHYGYGGGLYLWEAKGVDLINNTIKSNIAVVYPASGFSSAGGGIFASTDITLTAVNNIVTGNQAVTSGTGIYLNSVEKHVNAKFFHNVIVANKGGPTTGAISIGDNLGTTTAVFINNIIAGHGFGIDIENTLDDTVIIDTNCFYNEIDVYTGVQPVTADPKISPQGYPLSGSPVIQAGLIAGIPPLDNHPALYLDKDGIARPQSIWPNIGAYEATRNITMLPLIYHQ